ncbi:ABC transporter substrate-binding protein [Cupriavidus basilensis]|uniref:ABC transporter substrate-binding protein n=1 Tax=Cupriavidus basilensis TaxID=68895 RepID=UPI0039F689FE
MFLRASGITVAGLALSAALPSFAGEVEVLHWWTSGGEARSVSELKKTMLQKGDTWKDYAIAGGGGDNAMTALKTRVVSGKAPTAAQIKGPQIQEWGKEGTLANINAVAEAGNWDKVLPPVVADIMKYKGNYVAVPVNIHRVNWLWINPEALKRAGATVPVTMDDFFAAADKLKAAGIQPLAHGGQPWQDATLFESIALGVGGADFYRKAFAQLDPVALAGPTMVRVFEAMQRVKGYIDKGAAGRDWNLATAMVINGKAGMQFTGDWAKGEFTAANKQPGKDYLCVAAPGTGGSFTYNIDSLAMFVQKDKAAQTSQAHLAEAVMSPAFQEAFSLSKGSIPARVDVPMTKFDDCARKSAADLQTSLKANALLPSFAHKMAMSSAAEGAVTDVISQFMNSNMTPQKAAERIAKAARTK